MKVSVQKHPEIVAVLFFVVLLLGAVGVWVAKSSMEARAFCRLTGRQDVTWLDAMWVELRITE